QARWPASHLQHRVALAIERHLAEPGRPATYVQVLFVRPVGLHPEHADLAFVRVGGRAQEDAVGDPVHGGSAADAEGEGERGERGIRGTAWEDGNRIATVPRQLLEPRPSPDGSRVLLDRRDVAEPQHGLTTRLFGRHASVDVVARLPLDMVADLVVE